MKKCRIQLKNVATVVACFTKKVAMTAIAICISLSAAAQFQQGDFAVGINPLLYGIYENDISSIGIGPKVLFNVTDKIRLSGEAGFSTGWLALGSDARKAMKAIGGKSSFKFQDYSVYGHYLFPLGMEGATETYAIYPLVGIGIWQYKSESTVDFMGVKKPVSDSGSKTVFTLGCGFDVNASDKLIIDLEMKLKLHDGYHFIVSAGFKYKFYSL